MHFLKAIYHTYSFDNQNSIKMNDTMIDILFHYVAFNSNIQEHEQTLDLEKLAPARSLKKQLKRG